MKRFFLLGVTVGLAALGWAVAGEGRIVKPHPTLAPGNNLPAIREQMDRMERLFVDVEIMSYAEPADYAGILEAVKAMEGAVATIRKKAGDDRFRVPLDQLDKKLGQLREAARKRNGPALHQRVDNLVDACFQCHASYGILKK